MTVVMANKRIRLIIDTEDVIRRAVHLRRVKMADGDATVSDVVNEILREALAREIAEVEGYAAEKKGRNKN